MSALWEHPALSGDQGNRQGCRRRALTEAERKPETLQQLLSI